MTECCDGFLWALEIDIHLCIHHKVGICERLKATIKALNNDILFLWARHKYKHSKWLVIYYSLHCWVSFSGFAEVYFEHTLGMESSVWAKTFKEQNKGG